MNAEKTLAAGDDASLQAAALDRRPRALAPSAAFWFAMLAASALGTNIGDFFADSLSLGLATSFGTLIVISALAIWGDRDLGRRTEAFFWLAIVLLRASATNVGDFLTHQLGMNYIFATAALGAATLFVGRFTRSPARAPLSPLIDLHYWGTMFIGGVFGTIGGDLTSHAVGLIPAAVLLGVVLILVIRARASLGATSVVGYWCIVLAERAAGTPVGDALASAHGASFGLPLAMVIAGAALLIELRLRNRSGGASNANTSIRWPLAPSSVARWALMAFSLVGGGFMARIYLIEHPRSPWLALFYGLGLALNFLYLAAPELARLRSFRLLGLVWLWFAAKRGDFDRWVETKEQELRGRAARDQPAE